MKRFCPAVELSECLPLLHQNRPRDGKESGRERKAVVAEVSLLRLSPPVHSVSPIRCLPHLIHPAPVKSSQSILVPASLPRNELHNSAGWTTAGLCARRCSSRSLPPSARVRRFPESLTTFHRIHRQFTDSCIHTDLRLLASFTLPLIVNLQVLRWRSRLNLICHPVLSLLLSAPRLPGIELLFSA